MPTHALYLASFYKRIQQLLSHHASKKPKSRDKFYDEVELAIGGTLARNVKIINKGKGGKLEIEYFDREDLLKLAKLFNED